VSQVVRKSEVATLSIYIPKSKLDRKPIERLERLGKKVDRSINYLVVDAIIQYLDREEKRR
jgi:predicted transcriptional regulator